MGPEDNFCSTKISKDSVLAKLSDSDYVNFKIQPLEPKKLEPFSHFSSWENDFPVVKSGF